MSVAKKKLEKKRKVIEIGENEEVNQNMFSKSKKSKTTKKKTQIQKSDEVKRNFIISEWKSILEDATLSESWPSDPNVFCTLKDDIVEYFIQEGSMKCQNNDCILWKEIGNEKLLFQRLLEVKNEELCFECLTKHYVYCEKSCIQNRCENEAKKLLSYSKKDLLPICARRFILFLCGD